MHEIRVAFSAAETFAEPSDVPALQAEFAESMNAIAAAIYQYRQEQLQQYAAVEGFWAHHVGVCMELLELLERAHTLAPQDRQIMENVVHVASELIRGHVYTDFDNITKLHSVTPEYAGHLQATIDRHGARIKGADPTYEVPKPTTRSASDCFVITAAMGTDGNFAVNELRRSYRVQPVKRNRLAPTRRQSPGETFTPEPAITDEDFADIIGDIVTITQSFERLAVTHAEMDEERLRDQILTMLGNVYGRATGESFSKRGKSAIYLPWEGGNPVFLAECKWWTGPKAFAEQDLPQLLDRYVVWRDTHAAMVLFIRNMDATAVIDKAMGIIRDHDRYVREADAIHGAPVFVLHKDGDPDRKIKLKLALVTAAIHR